VEEGIWRKDDEGEKGGEGKAVKEGRKEGEGRKIKEGR
jgi:hypothetical protein